MPADVDPAVENAMSTASVASRAAVAAWPRSRMPSGGGWIHRDIPKWERFLHEGRIDPTPIISGVYPLEQLDTIFRKSIDRELVTAVMDLR